MDEHDKKEIEQLIKKHKPSDSYPYFLTILFLLFLNGCFRSCGYLGH